MDKNTEIQDNNLNWQVVDENTIPEKHRYIVAVGKGGKTVYGMTNDAYCGKHGYDFNTAIIETGGGAMGLMWIKDVYAFAYAEITDHIWQNIPNQNRLRQSYLGQYLRSIGKLK